MAYVNNNQNRTQISTTGISMFDNHKVQLRCNFLDTSMNIAFWLPGIKPDGSSGYPETNRFSSIIRPELAAALYNIAIYKVIPAIEEKREYEGGIFINRDRTSILQFQVEIPEFEGALPIVKLVYMTGIDMEKNPKNTYVYEFSTSGIIENFIPGKDTEAIKVTDVQAQLWMFCEYIKGYLLNASNPSGHSIRVVTHAFNDRLYKTVEQIAVKVGVPITPYVGNRNGTASTEVALPASTTVTVPDEVMGSLDDLPF